MTVEPKPDHETDQSGRDAESLTGKILIAMPGMQDPRFAKAVVLVCAHSDDGAMGLVLNRPMPEVTFDTLLDQLDIKLGEDFRPVEVRMGGPVEPGRGFVLHRISEQTGDDHEGRLRITPVLAMTTTRDILEDLAHGAGPEVAVLALGYTGWGPGQLEEEMAANGWLSGEGGEELIFSPAAASKWADALRAQGIDPSLLSPSAGRA